MSPFGLVGQGDISTHFGGRRFLKELVGSMHAKHISNGYAYGDPALKEGQIEYPNIYKQPYVFGMYD